MIGRPKNFDQHVALQAATDLFWRRGYAATSLDDLLGVMSLSKSSFYAEFKSKEALYRACLKDYQHMIVFHLKQVRSGASSLRDFLDAIFQEAIDDATSGDPKGCLIGRRVRSAQDAVYRGRSRRTGSHSKGIRVSHSNSGS